MTRARALKQIIRARAAKTGERYTTARRHVLDHLRSVTPAKPAPSAPAAVSAPARTSGALSDATAQHKTGHGLDYWFGVLERFGGVQQGHTALARHLREDHGVPSWYCQGITVAYERARGARAMNQRCDGVYEVSVSKTMGATVAEVVTLLSNARRRARWTNGVDEALVQALAAAIGSAAPKGIVVRADGQGRLRYKWSDTVVQVDLLPKPNGRTSIAVTNSSLTGPAMVEQRRLAWRAALAAIARAAS